MRMAVPPREFAFFVTTFALARAAWAIAAVYLVLAALSLVDVKIAKGMTASILLPAGSIAVMLAALILLACHPRRWTGVLYLTVGTVSAFVYQYSLLHIDPELYQSATYLLNRLSVALVLVSIVGTSMLGGVVWSACGYILALAGTVAACLLNGVSLRTGWGPTIVLVVLAILMATLELMRRSQRRRIPDFTKLEAETARIVRQRWLEERATAIIHDTVLSDLTTIVTAGDSLDHRGRERFVRDLALLSATNPDAPAAPGATGQPQPGLYDEVLAVVSEFQWGGLTIDVSGDKSVFPRLAEPARAAIIWALRASLENVVRHAETDSVEVFITSEDDGVTIMVIDQGRGFDPDAVPADRLGIRSSIIRRIESCGGSVRLWSTPGMGTSVVFRVPYNDEGSGLHA